MVSLFLLLAAVSSTIADFKQHLSFTHEIGLQICKSASHTYERNKHETIVESQRVRTADILSTAQDSTAHDSTGEQSRQGDEETDRQTRRHTAPNSTTHRSTPQRNPLFSLFPPLFISSLPFSHTLLSSVSCENSLLHCQKQKSKNKQLSWVKVWPPWYTRHDKKSHNDKCINKPRWEEKRLLSDARLRARRASLWRDHHPDGNCRGAGAKRPRRAITKVVRTIRWRVRNTGHVTVAHVDEMTNLSWVLGMTEMSSSSLASKGPGPERQA